MNTTSISPMPSPFAVPPFAAKRRQPSAEPSYSRLALSIAMLAFGAASASADVLTQVVSQASPDATGWVKAIWGPTTNAPVAGNTYIVPAGFTLRTPNVTNPAAFPGDWLICTNSGTVATKHSSGAAAVNLIIGPGTISNFGGVGTTATPPTPFAGKIQFAGNTTINASGGGNPSPRHFELRSALSGSGNISMTLSTNAIFLADDGSAFTGNWNFTGGGRLEVASGAVQPLGSGTVNLANDTNSIVFNGTNNVVVNNDIGGAGYIVKRNTNTVVLGGFNTFAGGLTNFAGTLVLTGSGSQSYTRVASNSVLRVASSTALGYAPLRVDTSDALTARLELSNNVTVQTFYPIELSMRNNPSVALENVSGNNTVGDQISIQTGGGALWIQTDAGTTLNLAGGITSAAIGTRSVCLQGEGTGIVGGAIDNGAATAVTVMKTGGSTWTLNAYNSYSGATYITNGVLKLGPSAYLPSTSAIHLEPAGKLDVTAPGGITLGAQTLRGQGAVLGDVTTGIGTSIEVGFVNQAGSLNLSNNLNLNGEDMIRFDVASSSNDVLNVTGNLTLNGLTTNFVNLIGGFVDNGTYRLINYGGSLLGAGSLVLSAPVSRQTITLDTSIPHQVNLVVTGNPTSLVWSGDDLFNVWDVGATPNWNSRSEVFYNADKVTFDDTGSVVPDIDVTAPVMVTSMVVSNVTKNFTFVDTNGISSPGSLTKLGAGTLTFANAGNAFNGPITIAEGTLQIGNGDTNGSLGNGAILNQTAIVLNKASNNGATLGGSISGPGSIKVTSGSLYLNGTNSYTGPTTIETGDISIRTSTALGDPAVGTTVLTGGSVRIPYLGNYTIAEPITINGEGYTAFPGALYVNTVSNVVNWTGPITIGSASRIRAVNNYIKFTMSGGITGDQTPLRITADGTGNTVTSSGNFSIGNTAPLMKDGTGTLVLAGATNIAGMTTNENGTLMITSTNRPTIGDVTIAAGTLQIGDGGLNGAIPTGAITLVPSSAKLILNSSNSLLLDKELSGAGSISKLNRNTLTITSSNSFTGGVTTGTGTPTQGGTINLRNSFALGDGSTAKNISVIRTEVQLQDNLEIPAAITFQTSGGSLVNDVGIGLIPIRSLSGNNIIQGNISMIGGAGDSEVTVDSGTLTINGNITADTTSLRTLHLSGAGTGILNGTLNNGTTTSGLIKKGTGTWTLNNANGYTGTTIIQGGTLVLGAAANMPATPSIELRSNAVFNVTAVPGGLSLVSTQSLLGIGTVRGAVTTAGTVAPGTTSGTPIGTLTFDSSLALGSLTRMDLNRTNAQNCDLISAASVVFGGTLTVTNVGPNLQGGEVFNLFDGTLSGSFVQIDMPNLGYNPALSWNTNDFATLGIIKVDGGVPPPFKIESVSVSGNDLVIKVTTEAGFNYTLQVTPSVQPTSWSPVSTQSGGGTLTFTIPVDSTKEEQFFRIVAQ